MSPAHIHATQEGGLSEPSSMTLGALLPPVSAPLKQAQQLEALESCLTQLETWVGRRDGASLFFLPWETVGLLSFEPIRMDLKCCWENLSPRCTLIITHECSTVRAQFMHTLSLEQLSLCMWGKAGLPGGQQSLVTSTLWGISCFSVCLGSCLVHFHPHTLCWRRPTPKTGHRWASM